MSINVSLDNEFIVKPLSGGTPLEPPSGIKESSISEILQYFRLNSTTKAALERNYSEKGRKKKKDKRKAARATRKLNRKK